MANVNLQSIPTKTLKKIVREGKLSALISSNEGLSFFEAYLNQHPEFKKYWTFYNWVSEITSKSENKELQLEEIKQCFQKHIAIGADSEDRIDSCISNRSVVENFSKAINEGDCNELNASLRKFQESAYDYLNRSVFLSLADDFSKEFSTRQKTLCHLV